MREASSAVRSDAANGGLGRVADRGIRHCGADTDLTPAVQGTTTVRDPRRIGGGDRDARATCLAADSGIADHRVGPVPGHSQRRALVAGGIDTDAQAYVDLLGRVVRGYRHARGIRYHAVIQLRGGLVFHITIGHRAGDGRAALVVVGVGDRHRQRAADAHQHRVIERRDIHRHALSGRLGKDIRVADPCLGILANAIDRRAARDSHTKAGLIELLVARVAGTTECLVRLAEVLVQRTSAGLAASVGRVFQLGDFRIRARLELGQETGVFLVLFFFQIGLLLRLALGHRAGRRDCPGQAVACRLHQHAVGSDTAGTSHRRAGPQVVGHLANEGLGVGIHLLVGHTDAHRDAVGHRHRPGDRPRKQVFVRVQHQRIGGDVGAAAQADNRRAVQIQRRHGAIDANAAAAAGLQRERDDGFAVLRADGDIARAVDRHSVVDDRLDAIVVVDITDASTHRHAAVTDAYPLEGQPQISGCVDRGDVNGGLYRNAGVEIHRARISGLVDAVECRIPCAALGVGRRQPGPAGDIGTGGIVSGEIAHHAANRDRVRRALGRAIGGEKIRRVTDQRFGGGDGILERLEAAEVGQCRLQLAEIAWQTHIRTQANPPTAQLRTTAHQRAGFVVQQGHVDGCRQAELRAGTIIALRLHVADGVMTDLRIHDFAVDDDIPASGVQPDTVADRGRRRVVAVGEADRAAQPERRRRWVIGGAAVARQHAARQRHALACQALQQVHQALAVSSR